MRIAMFSTKPYDRRSFEAANGAHGHELLFLEPRLTAETAVLAQGAAAVCPFVNDELPAPVLAALAALAASGTRLIALRCAGFNNVDLRAAARLGLTVARVPAYSPHAVAEFTIGLLLTLVRGIHRAHQRTRDGNFALDGLLGFDLFGKTVGVIGTGRIGALVARALAAGFGCRVLAQDLVPDPALEALGIAYADLDAIVAQADILTLHCPLTPATRHLLRAETLARARRGMLLVNTSRGGLVDAEAAIEALKSGRLGGLAIDVYEQEADLFFEDLSNRIIPDDVLARLLTFPNVVVTGHQAFFTREALAAIADTTLGNATRFAAGEPLGAAEVTEAAMVPPKP
ncbi:2-hydroxyacid dehydrogenase [Paracraurococcus lichenis]|uniref:2-hydroxyacid dehydrogenase n=1 Tax=Paracraurococcus lichenis TaxID=3064888 RepID=A0ABT9E3E2_9PROT|nr:2-hydroxyacid dehydrogenase [Paracraurococcus sp. LOR1-02]MDO9710520.1 2-hydroxyacid dehydrogenase [Paracraurococcus sp. LOR1-02]